MHGGSDAGSTEHLTSSKPFTVLVIRIDTDGADVLALSENVARPNSVHGGSASRAASTEHLTSSM